MKSRSRTKVLYSKAKSGFLNGQSDSEDELWSPASHSFIHSLPRCMHATIYFNIPSAPWDWALAVAQCVLDAHGVQRIRWKLIFSPFAPSFPRFQNRLGCRPSQPPNRPNRPNRNIHTMDLPEVSERIATFLSDADLMICVPSLSILA